MLVFVLYTLIYVLSSSIILARKRELVALLLLSFLKSCYCKYHVALPYGTVELSAVCNCVIS